MLTETYRRQINRASERLGHDLSDSQAELFAEILGQLDSIGDEDRNARRSDARRRRRRDAFAAHNRLNPNTLNPDFDPATSFLLNQAAGERMEDIAADPGSAGQVFRIKHTHGARHIRPCGRLLSSAVDTIGLSDVWFATPSGTRRATNAGSTQGTLRVVPREHTDRVPRPAKTSDQAERVCAFIVGDLLIPLTAGKARNA